MPLPWTIAEAALEWGVSKPSVQKWCKAGIIRMESGAPGAKKHGRDWLILSNALKPDRPVPGRPRKHIDQSRGTIETIG